jgi:Tol biopolymer transport system component/tRNA A-37 threonylcarbamoyl transferase component Bud32
MSLLAGTKLGAYEIVTPLGAGGMGEVYRARDAKLGRDVAIKVLPEALAADRAALERLEREARTLASTSHPNILSIFDFGTSDGSTYIVMELLDGHTLRTLLHDGPLPVRKATEYAIQIAQGLGAAHERGIIHRDLKPENLFITRDGRVKILDFGLARQNVLLGAEDATAVVQHQTEPGMVLGTIGYMSPEQVQGKPADARSDIFSFGAVVYEMLAGRRAFRGDSAADTMHAILREDPPDLNETAKALPPALDRIVAHCLEKSPDQRFQSARDVAFNLESLSTLSSGRRSGVIAEPPKARWRPALVAAALVGAGALAGGLAGWMLRSAPPPESPVFRRLTFDRGEIGQARFAPDGQTIVYSALWRGLPSEIYTTRIGSRESRPLGLGNATLSAVSSASELAVGSDTDFRSGAGTLGRVPLAGGATRASLEHISFSDWSPDGTELAVVRIVGNEQHIEFPVGKVIYRSGNNLTHLRVSPGGDWLAFAEHPIEAPFAGGTLVSISRDGTQKAVSKFWSDIYGVAWRGDGREIWFAATDRSGEYKSLWASSRDGAVRLVTRMPGQVDLHDISRDGRVLVSQVDFRQELLARPPGAASERALTWLSLSAGADMSSDGSRVLFNESQQGGGSGQFAYIRPTDGAPAVRLGEADALSLSPDGKWALALLPHGLQLAALPTGAGEVRNLARPGFDYTPKGPVGPIKSAGWFPDSRHILFNASKNGGPFGLFVQDIEGGEPQAVGPPGVIGEAVSPDGKRFVAQRIGDLPSIYDVKGGEPIPCKGIEPGERPIRWSQDGRSLICRRNHGLSADVSLIEIATGRRTLLWRLAAADPAGASPVTSIAVTPDAKGYAYSFFRNVADLYMVEGLK